MGELNRNRKDWTGILYVITIVGLLAFGIVNLFRYPNEGNVNISLEFEKSTDYRVYQYVAGKVVDVKIDGQSEMSKVITKPFFDGTLIMISDTYKLDEAAYKFIEITYDTSEAKINKNYSKSSDIVRTWINEYSYASNMEDDLPFGYAGKDSEVGLAGYESIYTVNFNSFLMLAVVILYAIILIIFRWRKIEEKNSVTFLVKCVNDWNLKEWFERKKSDAEKKFQTYIIKHRISSWLYIATVLLVATYYICTFGRTDTNTVLYFGCIGSVAILLFIVMIIFEFRIYKQLQNILVEECDPYQAILAFSKIYEYSRGRDLKTGYAYNITNAIALFWIGKFEEALRLGEMIWDEAPIRVVKSAYFVHYHSFRHSCFRELGDIANCSEEWKLIEKYLNEHPKKRKNKMVQDILKSKERIDEFDEKQWEPARILFEEYINTKISTCAKAAACFRLWQICAELGDLEASKKYAVYAKEKGSELFFFVKIN